MASRTVKSCDFCRQEAAGMMETFKLYGGEDFDVCEPCIDRKQIRGLVEVAKRSKVEYDRRQADKSNPYAQWQQAMVQHK